MDMDKLFGDLGDTLAGAIAKSDEAKADKADADDDKGDAPDPVDEVKKSVDNLNEKVAAIAKALAPGREAKDEDEGEEPGEIVKAIKELGENAQVTREALEKTLERVEALENGTVVRKSAAGDDDNDDDKGDDDTQLQKGKGSGDADLDQIGNAMRRIAKNPGEAAVLT